MREGKTIMATLIFELIAYFVAFIAVLVTSNKTILKIEYGLLWVAFVLNVFNLMSMYR